MAILIGKIVCDRTVDSRKTGRLTCSVKAKHSVKGVSGGILHYCNSHLGAGLCEGYEYGGLLPGSLKD